MITKKGTLICDICGLFCKYYDQWTPYGCADPSQPEPYDPCHICKKCFPKVKEDWIKKFKSGERTGDWTKSRAEEEAAEECSIKWVGSNGIGSLNTKDFANAHQYISKEEHDRLSKLPYWGYCKDCGAKREGGHCSNTKCKNYFKTLILS